MTREKRRGYCIEEKKRLYYCAMKTKAPTRDISYNKYVKLLFILIATVLFVMYNIPSSSPQGKYARPRVRHRQRLKVGSVRTDTVRRQATEQPRRIPRRIHQTYESDTIPKVYETSVLSWHRTYPSYEFWFWRDVDIRLLIKRHYPRYLQLFDSYKYGIERSDLGRYVILHHFGGIYVDLDFESFSNFDDYLQGKDCVLVPEPGPQSLLLYGKETVVTNSIMMFLPRHQLLRTMIENLREKPPSKDGDVYHSIYETGPIRLQQVLDTFLQRYRNSTNPRQKIHLAENDRFLPSSDRKQQGYFRGKCSDIFYRQSSASANILSACADLHSTDYIIKRSDSAHAYCDHRWMHLGYMDRQNIEHIPLSTILGGYKVKMYGGTHTSIDD